ncbi:SusD-like starch-binding protein associating with outer membrane [Chitinophaga niastensis]|uniref:SusD-like starch-binding protein associating with outer membrane n=1 Tax=Chitinophaga niastensis TaxID=536980 RepID=A0A2P8HT57_CHINA|nr:RagB/SusD family nutrient uptake outer membrane protein [Chitinophaga niastensis]PSL49410.1 SusD-like starch-binding protein associating with outer membrane [Chitinophaga niastensis]
MTYNKIRSILIIGCSIGFAACNLNEKLGSTLTKSDADSVIKAPALLKTAYDNLQMPYQDFSNTWGLSEMSTDEAVGPTRAGDWDDNGVWRALHQHIWTSDHAHIQNAFSRLLLEQFSATNVLNFKPTAGQAAEARFLRAFSMFSVLDLWGQVPFRNPTDTLLNAPKVLKAQEALDYIIAELTAITNDLGDRPSTPAYVANKDAARFLLMKCYLNKGAFLNRQSPTFDAGDMAQVIKLADQITNGTGSYSLANNYYDNFARDNDVKSTENIFTQQNGPGISTARGDNGNNVFARWKSTLHYNMIPSGWNGFTTLSDFYDKYEATDTRRGGSYSGVTDSTGLRVGFLVGQQYNVNGVALKDRKGNMLAFTRDVQLKETGNTLEITGIRVVKYPPDLSTSKNSRDGNEASNDFVFFRYADVLLMKAEALVRTGKAGDGLTIVNQLRTKRGASAFGALDVNNLLDERGRELFWEGWRRQDLIRFGKFLQPWQLKPTDDPKYLLFPIPTSDLAVNPNLKQNPGY